MRSSQSLQHKDWTAGQCQLNTVVGAIQQRGVVNHRYAEQQTNLNSISTDHQIHFIEVPTMSDLNQNDHQLWMNPMDSMYQNVHSVQTHQAARGLHDNTNLAYYDPKARDQAQQGQPQAQPQILAISNEAMDDIEVDRQGYRVQRQNPKINVSCPQTSKGEKQIERAERKRKRERQRREDVNRLFEDLNAILAKIEKEQNELFAQEEQEHLEQDDEKMKKKLKWIRRNQMQLGKNASSSSLNRAEVIARAASVLEELSEERRDQRVEIKGLKQELAQITKVAKTISSTHDHVQTHIQNSTQATSNANTLPLVESVISSVPTQTSRTSTNNPNSNSNPANGQANTEQQVVMMVPMMVPASRNHRSSSNQPNAAQPAFVFPQFPNAATIQSPAAHIQTISNWNNSTQNATTIAFNPSAQMQHMQPFTTTPGGMQAIHLQSIHATSQLQKQPHTQQQDKTIRHQQPQQQSTQQTQQQQQQQHQQPNHLPLQPQPNQLQHEAPQNNLHRQPIQPQQQQPQDHLANMSDKNHSQIQCYDASIDNNVTNNSNLNTNGENLAHCA